MREEPITFDETMVRALLQREKRVARLPSRQWERLEVGDKLWVRETWAVTYGSLVKNGIAYHADFGLRGDLPEGEWENAFRYDGGSLHDIRTRSWTGVPLKKLFPPHSVWRRAAKMPRWASRITLVVREPVRVERLHDITTEEAYREGVIALDGWFPDAKLYDIARELGVPATEPEVIFSAFWRAQHRAHGRRWHDNPEVRRVAFEVESIAATTPAP